jgi:predicted transcriptional regulator
VKRKRDGTKLAVFSGKEERLNRIIMLILEKQVLIPYDIWLRVKAIKGFRHTRHKTVCRRVQSLLEQGFITIKGKRDTKPSGSAHLYVLSIKGQAALKLSEKTMDEVLESATDEQLLKLIEAL